MLGERENIRGREVAVFVRAICFDDPNIITMLKAFMSSLNHKPVFHVHYITATMSPFRWAGIFTSPRAAINNAVFLCRDLLESKK